MRTPVTTSYDMHPRLTHRLSLVVLFLLLGGVMSACHSSPPLSTPVQVNDIRFGMTFDELQSVVEVSPGESLPLKHHWTEWTDDEEVVMMSGELGAAGAFCFRFVNGRLLGILDGCYADNPGYSMKDIPSISIDEFHDQCKRNQAILQSSEVRYAARRAGGFGLFDRAQSERRKYIDLMRQYNALKISSREMTKAECDMEFGVPKDAGDYDTISFLWYCSDTTFETLPTPQVAVTFEGGKIAVVATHYAPSRQRQREMRERGRQGSTH